MSVLFSPADINNGLVMSKSRVKPTPRRKEDDLLVFGYACTIHEDSSKALHFEQEKHLIPWMGDEKFLIDRYDARLHFTDQSQFLPNSSKQNQELSPEEEEMELLCNEERYCDLHKDMNEHDLYQEEEMKRFQQAVAYDGAYNAAPFTYEDSTTSDVHPQEQGTQYGPSAFDREGKNVPVMHQGSIQMEGPSEAQASEESAMAVHVEPFVPPDELEVPQDMEIPQTQKMNAIIEKTALFVSKQGQQMEILIKAKQSGNPQFEFLNFENWLNPYYKHLLKYVKEGKYTPQVEREPSPPPPEEPKDPKENEASDDDDDDESDGEYELHPLLQASLHKKVGSSSSKTSSPGVEAKLSLNFVRSFHPASVQSLGVPTAAGSNNTHQATAGQELVGQHEHDAWYSTAPYQNQGSSDVPRSLSAYDPTCFPSYATTGAYHYHPLSTTVTSAASMIPPPPPPPGEGPLEEEWIAPTSSSAPPIAASLPPPPLPPFMLPEVTSGPYTATPSPTGATGGPWGVEIVPPPPDIQPIIDKLADYVARNGNDFEAIVKKKNEERFAFLNPWNVHHKYYLYKRQLCKEQNEKKRQGAAEGGVDSPTISKGPISFSIKTKDIKKPKIEYRTSVIYKQSCEQGESDEEDINNKDEDEKEVSKDEPDEKANVIETAGKEEQNQTWPAAEVDTTDLNEQMKSIEAAEREVLRLEAESRDKQIQSERRRRASLFISMLKKTSAGGAEGSSPPRSDDGSSCEDSDSQGLNEPAPKRSRFREKQLTTGVGVPSNDSIRVTQDLMAKVKAASKR